MMKLKDKASEQAILNAENIRELDITGEEEIVLIRPLNRRTGASGRDEEYLVPEKNLIATIRRSNYSDGDYYDTLELRTQAEVEAPRKMYAQECGKASREAKIPFQVALALGPEKTLRLKGVEINRESAKRLSTELECENKRKTAIREVFGEELYESLGVGALGKKYSSAISDWLRGMAG